MHARGTHGYVRYLARSAALLAAILAAALGVPGEAAGAPVAHSVEITGVADEALKAQLVAVSETMSATREPPGSLLHLRRRADRDQKRFLDVFHSQGHYAATVDIEIDRETAPVTLRFVTVPGPVFVLRGVRIENTAGRDVPLPEPAEVGLKDGAPALADAIAAGNGLILKHLRERGYPSPQITFRDVLVHPDTTSVEVTYRVDAGAAARFGELRLLGLAKVRPQVVEESVPWKIDDVFDERGLATLRRNLYDTGLFSTVTVSPELEDVGADGRVPVSVEVLERPQQTVAFGLEYKTDTGPSTQAHWENRNLQGLGRRLSVDGVFGTQLRQLGARYRIEHFKRDDQTLTFSAEVTQEERDAFDSDRVRLLAMVDRQVTERLAVGAGAGIRVSKVKQAGASDNYELAYFPVTAALDRSNDRFDPTSGFRVNGRIEPYVGLLGEQRLFVKGETEISGYFGLGGGKKKAAEESISSWVMAMRLKVGMLVGEGRDGVPADVRFYGGGGASIRGYAFQSVSPLKGDTPLGGRSLTEFSLELRKRITKDFGLAAFVDGGSAFESSLPDFGDSVKFGAGVGLRYFTPLGPLRFDVAVPLQRREGIDDLFQIYLSIGQAF